MITTGLAALIFGITAMDEREDLLKKAQAAVAEAVQAAEADSSRPAFHFRAPAQWMNDPNGPIYFNGWHHVFYQFNPYGDQWGNMHWGHARSKDLVDWEYLPIALWPSRSKGEEHVFSGSTFLDRNGKPMIFYTSIGDRAPEQWIARPEDDSLINWFKPSANPVLTEKHHGTTKIDEWRDPFLFTENNGAYMLLGGRHEGKGSVELYKADNLELTKWHFEGVLFHHPNSNLVECPNIAKLGDKWLLLTSHDGRVDWFVGDLDLGARAFRPENSGILAEGSYASQLLRNPAGKLIHLAWVPTNEHKGWNGYLSLPSTLELSKGQVLRRPIADIRKLRDIGKRRDLNTDFDESVQRGEIRVEMCAGSSLSLGALQITYDGRVLTVSGRQPYGRQASQLKLIVFIDGEAVDLYADDGRYSACLRRGSDKRIVLRNVKRATMYELRPARFAAASTK